MPTREVIQKRKFQKTFDEKDGPKLRKNLKTTFQNETKKKRENPELWEKIKGADEFNENMFQLSEELNTFSFFDDFLGTMSVVEEANLIIANKAEAKEVEDSHFGNDFFSPNEGLLDQVYFHEVEEDKLYKVNEIQTISEYNTEQVDRFETIKEEEPKRNKYKLQKAYKPIAKIVQNRKN